MEDKQWIESEKGFIDNMEDKSSKRLLEEIKELIKQIDDKLNGKKDDEK